MKDVAGNEVHVGAILKVFHFVGSRGRRNFMYKQVVSVDEKLGCEIAHLPINDKPKRDYGHRGDFTDSLVIQCSCNFHIHTNLKTHKKFTGC